MQDRLEPALIALRRILRITEINARALAKTCGLTPSQLLLMQIIDRSGEETAGALAKEVSLSGPTMTALLDKLGEKGLVSKRRDTADKRKVYVSLTDDGASTIRNAPDSLQARFEMGFSQLPRWEQAFLVAALERTAALLDADDLDAAPLLDAGGLCSSEGTGQPDPTGRMTPKR